MTEARLRDILNEELAKFAGQVLGDVNKRFDELEGKVDRKADADRVYQILDTILKNQETEQQERAAMIAQLNRHERWHHQTADKLGLKLEY